MPTKKAQNHTAKIIVIRDGVRSTLEFEALPDEDASTFLNRLSQRTAHYAKAWGKATTGAAH